ncbi:hypothetical protein E8K88_11990 [Lampropedia aestuarii]|uniref:Holin n=1 Tax=Lampropedia aestuarii TaxID=2562762 RepID=A0A4S5BIZ6_9BURK|nr:hypothetical protein E8K88_11990 [Lampropedia aestuarii]
MKRALTALLALIGVHQHLNAQQKHDLATAGLAVTPSASMSVVTHAKSDVWGVTPANMVAWVTCLFIALQIGHLIWKWRTQARLARIKEAGLDATCTELDKL